MVNLDSGDAQPYLIGKCEALLVPLKEGQMSVNETWISFNI